MSYDIRLKDPVTGECLVVEENHHITGGTYAIGGTNELHLNVTYNYSGIFKDVLGEQGIRAIYGMSGAESIPVLKQAIGKLSDRKHTTVAEVVHNLSQQFPEKSSEFLGFFSDVKDHVDAMEKLKRVFPKSAVQQMVEYSWQGVAYRYLTDSYWNPTPGNAKAALYGLLAFAQMRPDGVWDGD